MAQVLLLREFMVALLGHEVVIGVFMGNWLLAVALGSVLAGWLTVGQGRPVRDARLLACLLGAQAFLLPAQVLLVRNLRTLLGVPPGEWVELAATFWSSLAIVLPTCLSVGLAFPLACRILTASRPGVTPASAAAPVAWAYAMDGAGSMAGGILLTFALLPRLSLVAMLALLGTASLYAAIRLSGVLRRGAAAAAGLLLTGLLAVASLGGALDAFQDRLATMRWTGLGALPPAREASESGGGVRLVATATSVYQDLAVTEQAGQFVLYANGHVQFAYPDSAAVEHEVHFVMAQKPRARRVLVMGGNPVGEVAEILKFPVAELVHVELDPMVSALVRRTAPAEFARVAADARVRFMHEDAGRFAARAGGQAFDVIFVYAPQPTTAALNRFYTVEFYRALARLLAPDGFVYTSVRTSERLRDESAMLGASVYHALADRKSVV